MVGSHPPVGDSKLTVRYAGDKLDARQVDGKIWFAVEGQAVLTREQQGKWDEKAIKPAPGTTANVTASIHVVLGGPSPTADDRGDPAAEGDVSPVAASREQSALLLRAAQVSPAFAAATALSPGIHIMCYLPPPPLRHDATGVAGGKPAVSAASVTGKWAALWKDVRAGTGPAEEAELLVWQTPCQRVLTSAGYYLESEATLSLARSIRDGSTPSKGWALVPCARSNNLVCVLARGARAGDGGGMVAWLHRTMDTTEAAAGAVALADSLLLTSDDKPEPTYASISALSLGTGEVGVVVGAHRVITGGVLSGYDLSLAPPNARLEPDGPTDEKTDDEEPKVDRALFLDDSTAPADVGQSWRGAVMTEELPGGGLHRHVRVIVDVSCAGKACGGLSGEGGTQASSDSEWCEVLLAQHIPEGAYVDVDEVKTRHDFDVRPSLPTSRTVGVETFEGEPIDVELPSSVSGQHLVNFSLWVDMSKRDRGREGTASIRAEMTLPVHLRYPDPGCERRGEDCEEYAWVEVPPPLASIRCGSAGDTGLFYPVLPFMPPVGVALRVPRGIAWHRDFVMWGTVAAAALGCLYTVRTLLSVMSMGTARDSDRKRR